MRIADQFEMKIEACEDEVWWTDLVQSSTQGSIFNAIWYLNALAISYSIYKVENEKGVVIAGFVILEERSKKRMALAPYPFTPYQGILFSQHLSDAPNHKRIGLEMKVVDEIIRWVGERYENFSMSLSPNFSDIRPFLWHNYSDFLKPKFLVSIKYTPFLDLKDFSLERYVALMRRDRRQEYRKNISQKIDVDSVENFLKIYKETFIRQGIELLPHDLELVSRITTASIENGMGVLKKIDINGDTACSSLFVIDGNMAYYLFGANNPEYRSSGSSTALMVSNIAYAAEMGCQAIDFVGANSPHRADYKLSFNGVLKPYFQVKLEA